MKKILFILITFYLPFNCIAQGSKLNKQNCDKVISYFEKNSKPIMYWNSCDPNWGKTLYQNLEFRSEQIENSNLYNLYTSQDNSAIPFDEKGYIADTIIENSAIDIDYLYVYDNGSWFSVNSLLNLSFFPCKTNIDLVLPEFKSDKSLPFKDFGYISSSTKGNDFYIKVEERNTEFIEFWLKVTDPLKKVKGKNGKYITKGGGYDLMLIKIYCKKNYCDIEKKYKYSKDGKVLFKDDIEELSQRIITQTSIDIAREYICD